MTAEGAWPKVDGNALYGSEVDNIFRSSLMFGDGSDGDVTLSGATAINDNKNYASLIINTGVTATVATGKMVKVMGTLTLTGTATITSGGAGTPPVVQSQTAGGSGRSGPAGKCGGFLYVSAYKLSGAGTISCDGIKGTDPIALSAVGSGNGANGTDGQDGVFRFNAMTNSGGNGGVGGSTGAGGAGGAASTAVTLNGTNDLSTARLFLIDDYQGSGANGGFGRSDTNPSACAGAGGGSGGAFIAAGGVGSAGVNGDGNAGQGGVGGAGGGAGGILVCAFLTLDGSPTTTLSAQGADGTTGSTASTAGGNSGGGGGGSGGLVIYWAPDTLTTDVTGGAGGAAGTGGQGTPSAGSAGSAGRATKIGIVS